MRTTILTTDTPGHMIAVNGFPFLLWPQTVETLKGYERIITLGTPIISGAMLSCGPEWLNLHGGNPEYYRGLDSHWWAIYHSDWDNIMTTLHYIDDGIDTGNIVAQSQVPLAENLYEQNMEVCHNLIFLAMCLSVLPQRKQVKRGRYYGAMPKELKDKCLEKLRYKLSK
jgi:hypothetical protein